MAGSPALLLLLSLGLCCTGTQGQRNKMEARFLHRNLKHPQEGQQLQLECLHCERNRPLFWIRLDKSGNLHFISSTHSYSTTMQEGEKTAPNFEVLWRGSSYRLLVKSFTMQDEGTYFCVNYINQVLHFSSGQPAFFPVTTTTAAPTTPAATTQSSQVTTEDISQHSPNTGISNENTPHFCHKIVMWVNLPCACLLLLTAITITITHCQRRPTV
ncbi:T-cell surface glycoprotein CD8 alpha chain isoform X12 [Lagopus muta]|uniref:T-cell surface glycoprotein CD8 alpha chain isoform X12 n=1 Tax=Lagopus muta TaxID=64668 RepID=UPI00209D57D6|nr:T-cell surface glycoprotein CD8 alpha chain isoform X12 [Lagopus muta]